jgi:hypothetical protein
MLLINTYIMRFALVGIVHSRTKTTELLYLLMRFEAEGRGMNQAEDSVPFQAVTSNVEA